MKISTLLDREPFGKIFEKTLSSFFTVKANSPHIVKWLDFSIMSSSSNSFQEWYCNPRINAVFVKGFDKSLFDSINGEYAVNPLKPWRSKFQRLYLRLAQSSIFCVFLSRYKVTISPEISFAKSKLIIGGNTKLRLIDLVERKVYVILKDGFDHKFVHRELYVKSKFPFIPTPRLAGPVENSLWYAEEYISGKPPNRFPRAIGQKILLQAINKIHLMLYQTQKPTNVGIYANKLNTEIQSKLASLSYVKKEIRENLAKIAVSLVNSLRTNLSKKLTIAYCHGDFHQGNIIANEDDYWLLDWEHSGEKQIAYDLMILLIESRSVVGYASRFLNILNNELNPFQRKIAELWPKINWHNDKYIYLTIFLLEEIIFYIEENDNSLFFIKTDALAGRCREFIKIVDCYLE